MIQTSEDKFMSINIEYKFSSYIGNREASDCITEYTAVLYAGDYDDNSLNEYVGEICFKIINLSLAKDEGFDIYEMFDTYEYTFRHGQNFYNFKTGTFKKPILKEFPEIEIEFNRICIIESIGIVPKFRGKNMGAKAFKDLAWHFNHCILFILQPFPLQFGNPQSNVEFLTKLDMSKFEKNEKKATTALSNYYQTWGFKKIKGVKDLMFYCPLYRNESFDNIDMEDF